MNTRNSPYRLECRHFNGYKPCGSSPAAGGTCPEDCTKFEARGPRVLLIHLGALGAVVRSTCLLNPIRQRYGRAEITWLTQTPADQMLRSHPAIDRVLTTQAADLEIIKQLKFDIVLCVDKSLAATSIAKSIWKSQRLAGWFGFDHDEVSAAIIPRTSAAHELWRLGLSNHEKFYVNAKSEAQLTCEALELPFARTPTQLYLTLAEQAERDRRRMAWTRGLEGAVIGLNTGCSPTIPYKKLSIELHRKLIDAVRQRWLNASVVLLGGTEDSERNQAIGEGLEVIQSPTQRGLRDGMISADACDIVVSGDSLGMHLGIAFSKWVVAWFGPTCAQEVDLYDRGWKVRTQASCSPCWKGHCNQAVMCYDQVSIDDLILGIEKGMQWTASSSTKQRSSEMSSLPFL